jgi:hypothetical protein
MDNYKNKHIIILYTALFYFLLELLAGLLLLEARSLANAPEYTSPLAYVAVPYPLRAPSFQSPV